jgi:hypothetical protein
VSCKVRSQILHLLSFSLCIHLEGWYFPWVGSPILNHGGFSFACVSHSRGRQGVGIIKQMLEKYVGF